MRKISILLIFILVLGLFSGCASSDKIPDGVSEEFYNDMMAYGNELIKINEEYDKIEVEDSIKISKREAIRKIVLYNKNVDNLSLQEQKILKSALNLNIALIMYKDDKETFKEDLIESVEKFNQLMQIDLDIIK